MMEEKKQNWFRKHWIVSIFLGLIALGMVSSIFNNLTGNVIQEKDTEIQEEGVICNPDWSCGSWSECSVSGTQKRVCTDVNGCGISKNKPSETQSCEYKIQQETKQSDIAPSYDSEKLEESLNALKELAESLEKQQGIHDKIDECTKLCAGEDIDIPYVKSACHSDCYQIYYYTGEEGLDEYILELKNG